MRKNANTEHNGCFERLKGKYDVIFRNPILHKKEHLATKKPLEEAKDIYLKHELEFYANHRYMLPKFILIQKGKFIVRIQYKVSFDNIFRQIYLGCFDSLQSAEKAKIEFVTNIF